jgi:hypothetical protein
LYTRLIPALLAPALLLALAAPALAGNGNTLYLVQESPAGTTGGNNFLSDQTLANSSSIGLDWFPAKQLGTDNTADITIKSDCSGLSTPDQCGQLTFLQDNTGHGLTGQVLQAFNLSSHDKNAASVAINGLGHADLQQLGGGNTAKLSVDDGYGDISQAGLNNSATLTLVSASTGSIVQAGSSNIASMTVNSIGSGGANLTQIGSHLQSGPIIVDTTSRVGISILGVGQYLTVYN